MALHSSLEAFVLEITAFRRERGMNATDFGKAALNDGKFLGDLERGRAPSVKTIERVREYMRAAGQGVAA